MNKKISLLFVYIGYAYKIKKIQYYKLEKVF